MPFPTQQAVYSRWDNPRLCTWGAEPTTCVSVSQSGMQAVLEHVLSSLVVTKTHLA